jgi:hypothetical protein
MDTDTCDSVGQGRVLPSAVALAGVPVEAGDADVEEVAVDTGVAADFVELEHPARPQVSKTTVRTPTSVAADPGRTRMDILH